VDLDKRVILTASTEVNYSFYEYSQLYGSLRLSSSSKAIQNNSTSSFKNSLNHAGLKETTQPFSRVGRLFIKNNSVKSAFFYFRGKGLPLSLKSNTT
jgi:hypothetical protein